MQARWKLDLTEGYERQRIRLLPNYEFQTLYSIENLGEQSNSSEIINGAESRLSYLYEGNYHPGLFEVLPFLTELSQLIILHFVFAV
jgi:hypothetical protein